MISDSTPIDLQLPRLEMACIHCKLASLIRCSVHLVGGRFTLRLPILSFGNFSVQRAIHMFSVPYGHMDNSTSLLPTSYAGDPCFSTNFLIKVATLVMHVNTVDGVFTPLNFNSMFLSQRNASANNSKLI